MTPSIPMILPVILAATIGTASADQPSQVEICTSYSAVAEEIMTARQMGRPMSEMMKIADGDEPHVTMIMQAYDERRMMSPKHRDRTIDEFANHWYLSCARYMETK